jgi:hypothetical protein
MKMFLLRLVVPALVIALTSLTLCYQAIYLSWFDITPAMDEIHGSAVALLVLLMVPVDVLHVYIGVPVIDR